jgi:hypothetical protein
MIAFFLYGFELLSIRLRTACVHCVSSFLSFTSPPAATKLLPSFCMILHQSSVTTVDSAGGAGKSLKCPCVTAGCLTGGVDDAVAWSIRYIILVLYNSASAVM